MMMAQSGKKSQFELYFFYPAFRRADQDRIEKLLRRIKKSCKEAQIVKVEASGRLVQEQLFEKHFGNPKTSQLIRRRVGLPPRQLFKLTRSGDAIYLRGVVALAEGGTIQWANKPPQVFQMMEDLASRGRQAVEDLYVFSQTIKNEEVDLIDAFESSKYCDGNLERSYWLPPSKEGDFIIETSKWIDAVLKKPNGEYIIIEAEMELNYTAIGQALCYNSWFQELKKITSSRPAILCQDFKPEFLHVCKEIGIIVFCVTGGGVVQHQT